MFASLLFSLHRFQQALFLVRGFCLDTLLCKTHTSESMNSQCPNKDSFVKLGSPTRRLACWRFISSEAYPFILSLGLSRDSLAVPRVRSPSTGPEKCLNRRPLSAHWFAWTSLHKAKACEAACTILCGLRRSLTLWNDASLACRWAWWTYAATKTFTLLLIP